MLLELLFAEALSFVTIFLCLFVELLLRTLNYLLQFFNIVFFGLSQKPLIFDDVHLGPCRIVSNHN